MWDFLTFKSFITGDLLIFFYYTGAVAVPILLWMLRNYLAGKFSLFQKLQSMQKQFFKSLSNKDRAIYVIIIVCLFLSMEIMWRMMFETMIAYFQMRDYLQDMAKIDFSQNSRNQLLKFGLFEVPLQRLIYFFIT